MNVRKKQIALERSLVEIWMLNVLVMRPQIKIRGMFLETRGKAKNLPELFSSVLWKVVSMKN